MATKPFIFYTPLYAMDSYEDSYEVRGPNYATAAEAITWFDPRTNVELAKNLKREPRYPNCPRHFRVEYWELRRPTEGHPDQPFSKDIWLSEEKIQEFGIGHEAEITHNE